jgi:tripartite-type tricarboxylate transporter receptor subunit TctC
VRASTGIDRFETLVQRLRTGDPQMWRPPAPGTILQLVAEQVISRIGGRAEMIPYRGASAMLSDFLAGRLLFVGDNPAVHMEYLRDGSTRALAVLAAIGMEPALAGPKQFQATLADEMSRWRPAVAEMQRRMQ